MANEKWRHIVLQNPPGEVPYTSRATRGPQKRIPPRDPQAHSTFLKNRLQKAWEDSESEHAAFHADRNGVYIEFRSDPGADLVTKSLEDLRSKKVRLLNIRTEKIETEVPDTDEIVSEDITYATVYVSHDKKGHFLKKLQDYSKKETATGKRQNQDLVNSIADISKAFHVESFWTDDKSLIPGESPDWCEVWLSDDSVEGTVRFESLLEKNNIQARPGTITFPERAVKLVLVSRKQLELLSALSDDIAEYRLAKTPASFWIDMENVGQAEWVRELRDRLHVDSETDVVVCILDTGVNNGHPLLEPALYDEDCHSVDPGWGVEDHDKHGTLMAGVACYGDLRDQLSSRDPVLIRHRLESAKILPPPPEENPCHLWGYVTAQGVSRAEIQGPFRRRILCMPVTATDTRDRGRPSSWSGEIDQLASGARENDGVQRLFILSAGNLSDVNRAAVYPDAQKEESAHDPAQSWNALTVGAYTELDEIFHPDYAGYSPVAPRKGISPFTTTSFNWEDRWPTKPDIVMEGGNLGQDEQGFISEIEDLSLISTFYRPMESHFYPFNMTSSAAAKAAWFAAQVQSEYPDFWPETIRALMVHSAKWTEKMKELFLQGRAGRTDYARLLRICGYGVPDLGTALYSGTNSLTLIAQAQLQPFDRKEGGGYRTRDMHLHDLPWPKSVLYDLPPATPVSMRITLSYFIEPGPGEIGWKDRYRYASHGLRFRVKSSSETREEFLRSINAASEREEDESNSTHTTSKNWVIGPTGRNKGSIHSDIWEGYADQLAESNVIGVYPVIGWWRERAHLGKWESRTRYALVVSITTPEEAVDLYTPVATEVGISVPVEIDM